MASAPEHLARIEVVSGPLAGLERTFGDRLTIGRRPDNDLSLSDEQVSRLHAMIERRGAEFVVEDLGSRLGTRVDGVETAGAVSLHSGCHIAVGKTVLRFDLGRKSDEVTVPEAPIYRASITDTSGFPLPRGPSVQREVDMRTLSIDASVTSASLDGKTPTELKHAGKHLQTLLLANRIISTELDTEALLERILDAVFETFSVHRAVVMTLDPTGALTLRATRSRGSSKPPRQDDPQISSTIAYRALEERVGVLTLDASLDDRFDARKSIVDQNIRSAICAPMVHRDTSLGVIYVDTVGIAKAFTEEDLDLLTGIAAAAAGALRNATLVRRLKDTAADTIFRLAVAAEYRDDDTGFHIHRMSDFAALIAEGLGRDRGYSENLKLASPMHDIGKIGIPDSILKKPGKLTDEEFDIMKSHTTKGGAILSGSDSDLLRIAHQVALSHHEKFDGAGYPGGLSGEDIPIAGRIVAVADVFDALCSKRCYKEAFPVDRAFQILIEGRGNHFDPTVVDAFIAQRPRALQIQEHYAVMERELEDSGEEPSFENLWKRAQAMS